MNPEQFNVKELVATCCDTVTPLIQEGVELKQDVSDCEAHTDKACPGSSRCVRRWSANGFFGLGGGSSA